MPTKKIEIDRLLQELTDTMCHWDGESIAEKAEGILGHKVRYLGDGFFEISEEEQPDA